MVDNLSGLRRGILRLFRSPQLNSGEILEIDWLFINFFDFPILLGWANGCLGFIAGVSPQLAGHHMGSGYRQSQLKLDRRSRTGGKGKTKGLPPQKGKEKGVAWDLRFVCTVQQDPRTLTQTKLNDVPVGPLRSPPTSNACLCRCVCTSPPLVFLLPPWLHLYLRTWKVSFLPSTYLESADYPPNSWVYPQNEKHLYSGKS